MGERRVEGAGREGSPDLTGLLESPEVESAVEGIESPRHPIHEDRPDEALLNEDPVVSEGFDDLREPLRHPGASPDPRPFPLQRIRCDGRTPDLRESGRLLQAGPYSLLDEIVWDGLFEAAAGSLLVSVVDGQDRSLRFESILIDELPSGRVRDRNRGRESGARGGVELDPDGFRPNQVGPPLGTHGEKVRDREAEEGESGPEESPGPSGET